MNYLQLRAGVSQVGNINVGAYTIQNVNVLAGGFPYGSLGGLQAITGLIFLPMRWGESVIVIAKKK